MQRTTLRTIGIAALLVLTAVAGAAGTAVADSGDEDFFDGLVTDESDESGWGAWVLQRVSKYTTFGDRVQEKYFGEDGSADQYASDFAETYNANNKTIEAYANERLNASTDHDVFAIHFHDEDGSVATRYLVADVTNDSYANSSIVKSTSRTVDYEIDADWYVSKHAADELDSFVEEYAEPGKDLTTTYKAKMIAKYGGGLESGLWNGSDA